ncbi:hypothetical protein MOQ72_29375 [Saccharopolyspora sp. K220]|uniref:hypothetical protein n=1 Tax=Saccharopolyspora soli TaxID=2926618 RepID=UPI001F57DDD7|nr:hypothetical protein [Saccharopolyspora soli]MCI2421554.1 hypothetical protein [Saccharopolyspora soli]
MKLLRKYWGYVAALVLVYGWFSGSLGPNILIVLSAVTFLYSLFQAPVWCCAETRNQEFCRNNANGILMGCWIREHRWQKLKWLVRRSAWGRLFGRLLSGFHGVAASFSAVGTLVSATAAVITVIVKT